MSRDRFSDECPGCRPAMIDARTGARFTDDSPEMVVVDRLWSQTSRAEREAWHHVTCLNSRVLRDLRLAKRFSDRVQAALSARKESS